MKIDVTGVIGWSMCLPVIREHKSTAFYNDPQLRDILRQAKSAVADTDELLDKLLWA